MSMSPNLQNPEMRAKWDRLQRLRAALDALMTGQARNMVKDGDRETTRHPGNVKELRAEIQRLEIELSNQPRTFQVGANAPHCFDSFRRY